MPLNDRSGNQFPVRISAEIVQTFSPNVQSGTHFPLTVRSHSATICARSPLEKYFAELAPHFSAFRLKADFPGGGFGERRNCRTRGAGISRLPLDDELAGRDGLSA